MFLPQNELGCAQRKLEVHHDLHFHSATTESLLILHIKCFSNVFSFLFVHHLLPTHQIMSVEVMTVENIIYD